jgi:Spy/CpxP family protein refolding chaperone
MLTTQHDADLHDWEQLIRSEYQEIPGLCLTRRQAQRLWNLNPDMCDALLEEMVAEHFLRLTPTDRYVRVDIGL